MANQKIEEKLQEYRLRKEKQESESCRASMSVWERLLPNLLLNAFKSKIVNTQFPINDTESEIPNDDLSNKGDSSCIPLQHVTNISQNKAYSKIKPNNQDTDTCNDANNDIEFSTTTGNQQEVKVAWKLNCLLLLLKFALWVVAYMFFLELQWGAVFFVFSAFYFIFTNLRNGPRKPGEQSAYSVFNPGCEPIEGSIKPEQFERELRYGF